MVEGYGEIEDFSDWLSKTKRFVKMIRIEEQLRGENPRILKGE